VIKEGNKCTRIGKTRLEMKDIIKTELTRGFGYLIVMTDGEYKAVTPEILDVDTPEDRSWEYSHTLQRAAARVAMLERERLNSTELRRSLL